MNGKYYVIIHSILNITYSDIPPPFPLCSSRSSFVHHLPHTRTWMNQLLLLFSGALLLVSPTSAFYLPGIAPKDFVEGDQVPLHVNALQAIKSVLPYDFYNERFHFCKPEKVQDDGESLGSVLLGDRLKSSAFDVRP